MDVRKKEGDIGVCGIAILENFSCGIAVILGPVYMEGGCPG